MTVGYKYLGGNKWTKVEVEDRDRKRNETIEEAENAANDQLETGGSDSKKDQRTQERFFLKGSAKVEPETELRAKSTVRLSGLGKYINGLYYIESVRRNWGLNGFTQDIVVSRNALGDNIKSGTILEPSPEPINITKREDGTRYEKDPLIQQRVHILKSGETLSTLAIQYYDDVNLYTKIAKANDIKPREYTLLQVGRRLIIP